MKKKITVKYLKNIAKERNGKCLSKNYNNIDDKLKWKCKFGHIWESTAYHIIYRNQWCPYCVGQHKTIKDMHKLAKIHNGKCLSNSYINAKTKLIWQCNKNHKWEATPDSLESGHWCPICKGRNQTIRDMIILAQKRNGICLSKKYINNNTKLKWQCEAGHSWEAVPSSIKSGSWCPICAGNIPLKIVDMQKLAIEKGGKCLSKKYINSNIKLKWQCKKGHTWDATSKNIKTGYWCPVCAGTLPLTIEEMQKIATDRGGKCLSTKYINSSTKLKWQCSEGHIWENTPLSIKSGQWCPLCSVARGERICRIFFENIFNKNFPKSRPKWLINFITIK